MPTEHTLNRRTSAEKLPFDEGREAYQARMNHDANPYSKDDWRHNEWCLGWNDAEELDHDEMFDYATDSFKPER
ncbi:ribosome modulation factor [Vibrio anguillarum]|uniref:ribosome modulation factor n=1 Tax=Vibrio anguillarum TaxID=55601 RepID=UPI000BB4A222|nr:hypothetical protein [Vibrio anguillarum]ATC60318.1 hypothetical protein CMV05_23295 [Vibrio anguillarum]MBF4301967.1 hypothetical protein [Vibrio anguillarum]MBF4340758.1 hypothetical protein [Vibrio anguillarum]MBF4371189.1 hypothetical protein [Vibrio anguillarum]